MVLTVRRTATVSVIGFWLGGAATCHFISGMILSIVEFVHSDFQIESWHKYLLYVGIIWLSIAMNIYGARVLPAFNTFICKCSTSHHLQRYQLLSRVASVLFSFHVRRNHAHYACVFISKLQTRKGGVPGRYKLQWLGKSRYILDVVLCELALRVSGNRCWSSYDRGDSEPIRTCSQSRCELCSCHSRCACIDLRSAIPNPDWTIHCLSFCEYLHVCYQGHGCNSQCTEWTAAHSTLLPGD